MPNHCTNNLIVTGPIEELKVFHNEFTDFSENENGVKHIVTFNKILPVPAELENVVIGSTTLENGEKCNCWYKHEEIYEDGKVKESTKVIPVSQDKLNYYLNKFGYTNWYDWSIANWGTKWNAYDSDVGEISTYHNNTEQAFCEYNFTTAWSPPYNFLMFASKCFPNLKFEIDWIEEGGSSGSTVIQNSEEMV